MKIEHTQIYGFQSAIRAMRNPMNSWNLSDSFIDRNLENPIIIKDKNKNIEDFVLGEKDAKLSRTLTKLGSDHRKHLRMIQVWADITLPRFLHQELDTYKFVNKISCSTMHKLMSKPITIDDFEYDNVSEETINDINNYINNYKNASSEFKKELLVLCKNILPEGYLQTRTINTNYECLYTMYNARKNHKLLQWEVICNWIISLPYFQELTGIKEE